jgi:hypothetical protein
MHGFKLTQAAVSASAWLLLLVLPLLVLLLLQLANAWLAPSLPLTMSESELQGVKVRGFVGKQQ